MVKQTHTTRRQQPTNCLRVFDHFVGLALKGLKVPWHIGSFFAYFLRALIGDHPLSTYKKIYRKTNMSYPLIRTNMCVYQGVRNVSFSGHFAYGLNG